MIADASASMDANGQPIWTAPSPILDLRLIQAKQSGSLVDGKVVDFEHHGSVGNSLRFDLRSLALSTPPPNDDLTFPPFPSRRIYISIRYFQA